MIGSVVAFDAAEGWGKVASPESELASMPFHSTAIVGGTRVVAIGTAVSFRRVPGRHGRWEAADVQALPSTEASSASMLSAGAAIAPETGLPTRRPPVRITD